MNYHDFLKTKEIKSDSVGFEPTSNNPALFDWQSDIVRWALMKGRSAILAAHEVFGMGPGRSAAFADAYNKAMEQLADMFIADCDENHDEQLAYAKAQRDEAIRRIVGDDNFVPFDLYYGQAYMDELKRIRIMEAR